MSTSTKQEKRGQGQGPILLAGALLVGAVLLAVSTGPSGHGLADGVRALREVAAHEGWSGALRGLLGGGVVQTDPALQAARRTAEIVFGLRLARGLLAALVGAALSVAGVLLQALLRNPLADPFILGVSGGAAVGAAVTLLFGSSLVAGAAVFSALSVPGAAFGGALAATLLVAGFAARGFTGTGERLLLTGVVVNAFLSAVILLLNQLAPPGRRYVIWTWMTGNLGAVPIGGSELLVVGAAAAFGLGGAAALGRDLDLLALGDDVARSLGVRLGRTRAVLLLLSSLVTACAVAFAGLVGFVGLIVPHAARRLVGAHHRRLVPVAFLGGGAFLCFADTIARTVLAPSELPVGVLTALSGGPFFLWLLSGHGREVEADRSETTPELRAPPPGAGAASAQASTPPLKTAHPSEELRRASTQDAHSPAEPVAHRDDARRTSGVWPTPIATPDHSGFRVRGVSYRYRSGAPALSGLDLTLQPGELWAVWGPNGAGKSTLGGLLTGVLRPSEGTVALDGRWLRRWPPRALAGRVAYVPQDVAVHAPFAVRDVVLLGRAPYAGRFGSESSADRAACAGALRAFELEGLAGRRIDRISGGERRRAALARAVCQQTQVLVLDEPTASLDLRHRVALCRDLARMAREERKLVVLFTHDLDLSARFATHALLLQDGRAVAAGPLSEVLRPAVLEPVFGVPLVVHPGGPGGPPRLELGGS